MGIEFWDENSMLEFWGLVRMLLEGISPGVMITAAISAVGLLLVMVVKSWRKSSDDQDEDIEIRRY